MQEIDEEIEVLMAIFDKDFETRPTVWNRPSFAIKIKPTTDEKGIKQPKATVRFTLVSSYPKVVPRIEIETFEHLSEDGCKELQTLIENACRSHLGEVMCHDVVLEAQLFLEKRRFVQESLYEAMNRREEEDKRKIEVMKQQAEETTNSSIDQKAATTPEVMQSLAHVFQSSQEFFAKQKQQVHKQNQLVNLTTSTKRNDKSERSLSQTEKSQHINLKLQSNLQVSVLPTILELDSNQNALTGSVNSSRYLQEFQELNLLGNGASGEVWKVRHKLDRRIYAVKKIDLTMNNSNRSTSIQKIQREVTMISRLVHKYIVRYYAAWMEEHDYVPPKRSNSEDSDDSLFDSTKSPKVEKKNALKKNALSPKVKSAWQYGNPLLQEAELIAFKKDEPSPSEMKAPTKSNDELDIVFGDESSNDNTIVFHNDDLTLKKPSSSTLPQSFAVRNRLWSSGNSSSRSSSDEYSDSDDGSSHSSDSNSETNSESSSDSYSDSENNSNSSSKLNSCNSPEKKDASSSSNRISDSSKKRKVITSQAPSKSKSLFIQMEFCTTTLRELIDKNELHKQTGEVYRILRQALEALAYMHGRKVIHRDLKPPNIFLDNENNVKLGDFGLATFGHDKASTLSSGIASVAISSMDGTSSPMPPVNQIMEQQSFSKHSLQSDFQNDSELTTGVGTALYRAPEQEQGSIFHSTPALNAVVPHVQHPQQHHSHYNEKADMYSLGIILFEMCHPVFGTGMERLVTIKQLRELHTLPSYMTTKDKRLEECLCKIILWLTEKNPHNRPSANELLASNLMPARVDIDSKYLKEITEAIFKPQSTSVIQVMECIYNRNKSSISSMLQSFKKLGNKPNESTFDITNPNWIEFQHSNIRFDMSAFERSVQVLTPRLLIASINNARNRNSSEGTNTSDLGVNVGKVKVTPLSSVNVGNIPTVASTKSSSNKDQNTLTMEKLSITLQYYSRVKRSFEDIFSLHGCINYQPHTFFELVSSLSKTIRKDYAAVFEETTGKGMNSKCQDIEFINKQGEIMVLPLHSAVNLARNIAFMNLDIIHRYSIERAFSSYEGSSGAANSQQPKILEQISYDYIIPATSKASLVLLDVQVLSVVIDFWKSSIVQDLLPLAVIRLSNSDVFDAIYQMCNYSLNQFSPSSENYQDNSAIALHDAAHFKSRLAKVFSIATECLNPPDVNFLLDQQHIPSQIGFILQPLLKSVIRQDTTSSRHHPLQTLLALEKEFFLCVDKIKDELNKTSSSPSLASLKKDTGNASKQQNEANISITKKKAFDSTPIDLQQFGRKQQVVSNKGKPASSAMKESTVSTVGKVVKEFEDISSQWIRQFHDGAEHMKKLFCALDSNSDTKYRNTRCLIIDLGVTLIPSKNISPYQSSGIRFVLEAYSSSSQSEEIGVSTAQKKRHKKFGGILLDGGHYEDIIYDYREQYQILNMFPHRHPLYACGFTAHLDNIVYLLEKHENKCNSVKQFLPQLFPSPLYSSTGSVVALVVSDAKKSAYSQQDEIVYDFLHYVPHIASIQQVTRSLHQNRISSTHTLSQLHGSIASNVKLLCKRLQIPFLIMVEPTNQAVQEVFIESLFDDDLLTATQSHAISNMKYSKACVIPLFDCVNFILSRLQVLSPFALNTSRMKAEDTTQSSLKIGLPSTIVSHSNTDLHSPPSSNTINHAETIRPCYFLMINGSGIHYSIVAPDSFSSNNIYANYAAQKEKETSVGNNKRKRKDAELLTHKILETIAPIVNPHMSVQKLLLKPLNEISLPSSVSNGPVLFVVELTLSSIRNFNSLLMSLKSNALSSGPTGPVSTTQPKQELEGYFVSSQFSGAQKKLLRSILSGLQSLCVPSNEPVNSLNAKQPSKTKNSKGPVALVASSSTGVVDSIVVSNTASNAQAKKVMVYMYSVLDDALDLLFIETNILLALR